VSIKKLKTLNLKDFEMSSLQRNVVEFTEQLSIPPVDGVLIEDIEITNTATTTVNHLLDRKYVGYMIVKINQNSNIWADDADQILPTKTLVLSSSYVGTTTISLWVF
jgi:hypothetical protein